jgi:hypothetical protein
VHAHEPQPWLLALCQGLFLTNNVTFIAINGLVGLALAPVGWMATLPVMGYVVGGALSHRPGGARQARWGRKALVPAGPGWWRCSRRAVRLGRLRGSFWLLVAGHGDRRLLQRQRRPVPLCRGRTGGAAPTATRSARSRWCWPAA